jgi:3-methyladenine DNA glycosylase AlkD
MRARIPRPTRTKSVDLATALEWLERNGTRKTLDGMARYGIPSTHAYGVTVGALKAYAKPIGKDHALALSLWKSGRYEARLLAGFIGDPGQLTTKQMDAWASQFDNWAVCDTICFHLFDRTELAWSRVPAWATARAEFKKRAAFALLWGLTVHDKTADDARFLGCLPLIERAAEDERDYVKKGVSMALRAIGKRNHGLRSAAIDLAERMIDSNRGAQAWIGRSSLRELARTRRQRDGSQLSDFR